MANGPTPIPRASKTGPGAGRHRLRTILLGLGIALLLAMLAIGMTLIFETGTICSACGAERPLATAFQLGNAEAVNNGPFTYYAFPVMATQSPFLAGDVLLAVTNADGQVIPPAVAWMALVIVSPNSSVAQFDFLNATWVQGHGALLQPGQQILLDCFGTNVTGDFLRVSSAVSYLSGDITSPIP